MLAYSLLAALLALHGSAAAPDARLIVNGKTASTEVKVIGGSAYVKLADVARALSLVVVRKGDDYELTKAGGANQIQGLQGKVGDTLFDGKWRFSVLEVKQVDSYTMTSPDTEPVGGNVVGALIGYDTRTRLVSPKPGYKLILIRCRVGNGRNEKVTLWTAPSDDKTHTALADADGSSHPPVAYDFVGAPTQSQPLVPGANLVFPVLFSIPEGTQMKDLIFTLRRNNFAENGSDARVSLKSDAPPVP